MKPVKMNKYYWKFVEPIAPDGEVIKDDITLAHNEDDALRILKNTYPRWNVEAELVKVEEVELYGSIKKAKASESDLLDSNITEIIGEDGAHNLGEDFDADELKAIGNGYYD